MGYKIKFKESSKSSSVETHFEEDSTESNPMSVPTDANTEIYLRWLVLQTGNGFLDHEFLWIFFYKLFLTHTRRLFSSSHESYPELVQGTKFWLTNFIPYW